MKIQALFLVTQVNGHGGIPRFNRNIIKSIDEKTVDYSVLSLNDTTSNSIKGFNKSKLSFIFYFIKKVLFNKIDLVIIGHVNLVILSIIKMIKPSTKVVVILHGVEAWKEIKKDSFSIKKVDKYWAVSSYTKNTFSKLNNVPKQKMEQIFNTIPTIWENEKVTNERKNYFFSVTRLDSNEKYKGIDKIIEAMNNMKPFLIENNFKFIAVVSGDDIDRHLHLIKEYELESIIEFKSNLDDSSLQDLYKNCSFFILPSSGEGFGIVFLEAMLFKKACIGSVNCGTEDVINNNETGYLIEPTVENIQDKIQDFISNNEKCIEMGEKGYQKLHQEFTFKNFQKKINTLVLECVE
ncbi:MAG: glycosyltransferase family 4 protein [Flavobacteriaceae bacterium]|nr:glycosyltransferase family 4 protein [Flavobacteriaceae bacterium]